MTRTRRSFRQHAATAGALAAVTLLVAACGGASGSGRASSPPAGAAPSSGGSGALTIATAKGPGGTYLVGASNRSLYLWVADSSGRSNCSGECAKVWPPVLAWSTPFVSGGVISSDLGLATRANGQQQATYRGHPLYYYVADHHAGQGNGSFGAKWWLVSPSGSSITKSMSASTSSGGSASRGAYG